MKMLKFVIMCLLLSAVAANAADAPPPPMPAELAKQLAAQKPKTVPLTQDQLSALHKAWSAEGAAQQVINQSEAEAAPIYAEINRAFGKPK